ncbi:MAG: hypothetical protein CSB55_00885 [Candidatus Cloacimonadota bacterium]|nr:MAG: hypothetical protein CSB55_00885 [Candidatus Cloacimonadota bacterium]
MFRPSLRTNKSLVALALSAFILFYIADHSRKQVESRWYDLKIEAAKEMASCMKVLKEEAAKRGYEIDKMNDPHGTGLIGVDVSTITTSRGSLDDRINCLNPNLAAGFVDQLKSAGLKPGNYVAAGITGANPGLNLALYAAMKTLKLKPVIITSIGSAMYGANREDFTWLDMEKVLYDKKLIPFMSSFASYGGGKDIGRGLSKDGRSAMDAAIKRTNTVLINVNGLEENINARRKAYQSSLKDGKSFKLFINLGAGYANVGSSINAKLMKTGINKNLADKDFQNPGIFYTFAQKNIPVLNLYKTDVFLNKYSLPEEFEKTPEPGEGKVFETTIYNITIAWICLIVLLAEIVAVVYFDRQERHFTGNIVDPDKHI